MLTFLSGIISTENCLNKVIYFSSFIILLITKHAVKFWYFFKLFGVYSGSLYLFRLVRDFSTKFESTYVAEHCVFLPISYTIFNRWLVVRPDTHYEIRYSLANEWSFLQIRANLMLCGCSSNGVRLNLVSRLFIHILYR